MTFTRLLRLRTLTYFGVYFVALVGQAASLQATELLAHYEYECLRDNGCPHSVSAATEADFSLAVYPDQIDFRGYAPGETEDITIPMEGFITDLFTSGSLSAPEPMEFLAKMVGAGGGGLSLDKTDWRDGIRRAGPPVRVDAGYDVPLANGIDLDGTAVLTDVRFQLFDLEVFNSDVLGGSTMRSHYRYEFLGTRIPEPASLILLGIGVCSTPLRRRRES